MKYYNADIEEVLHDLKTSLGGLNSREVQERLQKYGHNELKEKKKKPAWLLFMGQFRDFMIIILIIAAILSGLIGDITETVIILLIVFLNATVGFIQEYRAEKALDYLKKLSLTQTKVIREELTFIISSFDLVPGDIVVLEAGNLIPADIRLTECYSFRVDESSLTGESVPVNKTSIALAGEITNPADQKNMAFKGTLVTVGRARGIVTATGMHTELGKIARLLQKKEAETPLQERMVKFSKNLSYIILLICAILFFTGLLRGEEPFNLLLLSISLAVAAIPEALPALITVALSRGAAKLAVQNALMRKLPAVETLGSVSFICSDKTGTLTQNKMKVVREYLHPFHENIGKLSLLHLGMALNQDVDFDFEGRMQGDTTEIALLEKVMHDIGLSEKGLADLQMEYDRVAELPFDADRKCMSTIHEYHGNYIVITKGAGESIGSILKDQKEADLLFNKSEAWAKEGLRVLAYAVKFMDELPEYIEAESIEKDLRLTGITALVDPPREEVKEAIRHCKTAGIRAVMITGDHPATAEYIAREIGILDQQGRSMNGKQLANLDQNRFLQIVENISVYARVSPEQKLRIVQSLQEVGHFTAMTGDGVNDAPTLRAANIGVAMGITGTDVSKEAAHMILLDDNFATIVNAVKEGRRIYDNIRKFVKYIMTCNSAEIWTIFLAPLLGLPMPLLPIHILWINLVTDGLPALALVNEKAEHDIMKRPPRARDESLFSEGTAYHILWMGLFMAGITLGVQAWAYLNDMAHWQTMVFTVLSLLQLGHVMGVRSERNYLFKQGLFSNHLMTFSILLTLGLQLMVIYVPYMNTIFHTQALSAFELGLCAFLALLVFHTVEFEKWIKRKFFWKRHLH